MLEIPEAAVLAEQMNELLIGKVIQKVITNQSPHKFAWFAGDPEEYDALLKGKEINKAVNHGGLIEVYLDDVRMVLGDGVALRLFSDKSKLPKKHQLCIQFTDGSFLVASVQMYGGMWCFKKGQFDNQYYFIAKEKPSPLSDQFNEKYFKKITSEESVQKKSVKALLATEQRIPGLGNGVLQDILYNAGIHPKKKVNNLSEKEKERIFQSIKDTLFEMTIQGGRDTEKDLFGCFGGYKTKLSKRTVNQPCEICGGQIIKKAYMGGSIYYCEKCQEE
ncbi:DNA-formamidopyrimidine glycosylase family protein [Vallitalea okinawensis]|uniref:DNA-formamidopyrimidine glycosylase family protein n=1 Tax=Vallitalea okinawensis TaxID=2078660 RepID=UPI000CFD9DB1|nr:DNA-formamidopyrimidine glycosylase family protein [Vallitalea okinawensis]